MKTRQRMETMGELAIGAALLIAVGWFMARSAQAVLSTPAAVNPQGLTQPNTTQLDGQSYFWPGPYSGSVPAGLAGNESVAGLTPISIPNLPVSAPYFGPTSTTPAGSPAAQSCCSCSTGYIGGINAFGDESALPYQQDSFSKVFIGGSKAGATPQPIAAPSPIVMSAPAAPVSKIKQYGDLTLPWLQKFR